MSKSCKILLTVVLSIVLLVTFASFAFFTFRAYRKSNRFAEAVACIEQGDLKGAKWRLRDVLQSDPTSEIAIVKLAEIARAEDLPPEEAFWRRRAMNLNPLEKSYETLYLEALVRMRAFDVIKSFLSTYPEAERKVPMDERANRVEELVKKATDAVKDQRFADAHALCSQATNLNWFATGPLLAQTCLELGRVAEAVDVYDAWTRRYQDPGIVLRLSELVALGGDGASERLTEIAGRLPQNNRVGIVMGCYLDALQAYVKRDVVALASAIEPTRDEIRTPVSRLMALMADVETDDAVRLESDFRDLMALPSLLDFRDRARVLVKGYVAKKFKTGTPAYKLLTLVNTVLSEEGVSDFELERLALLGQFQNRTLKEEQLEVALTRHPGDKALLRLQAWMRDYRAMAGEADAQREKENADRAARRASENEARLKAARASLEAAKRREDEQRKKEAETK